MDPASVVQQILRQIAEDPILGILPGSPGWNAQSLARDLSAQNWNSQPLRQLATNILSAVTGALEKPAQTTFPVLGIYKCWLQLHHPAFPCDTAGT